MDSDASNALVTLTSVLSDLQVTTYTQFVGLALLYWDWILTAEREVSLFWDGTWSAPRVLFFLNRYLPIIVQTTNVAIVIAQPVSHAFCVFFIKGWMAWSGYVVVIVMHGIVIHRLYGLYGRARRVVHFTLVPIYVLSIIASLVIIGYTIAQSDITVISLGGQSVCTNTKDTPILYAIWIPVLVFDAVAFALATYKIFRHLRKELTMGQLGRDLIEIMLRDNALYFTIVLLAYIWIATLWRYARPTIREIASGPTMGLISIMGSRMLLHVRERRAQDDVREYTNSYTSGSINWFRRSGPEVLDGTASLGRR